MLLIADGFDHYGDNSSLDFAYNVVGDAFRIIADNVPRTGTGSLSWRQGATNTDYAERSFTPSQTIRMGFAISMSEMFSQLTGNNFWEFNLFDSAGGPQLTLQVDKDTGSLIARRGAGNGTILVTTSPGVIIAGVYRYIEIGLKVDNVAGVLELRLDGDPISVFVGDTQNTAIADVGKLRFAGARVFGTPDHDYDDLYVNDTTGNKCDDFLGPIRNRTIMPRADTDVADWSPASGDGFSNVNNIPYDIAKFVEADTVGFASEFVHDTIPTNSSAVFAVHTIATAAKTAAGDCSVKLGINSDGGIAEGDEFALAQAPALYYSTFYNDPDDGSAWKFDKVNLLRSRINRTL